MTTIPDQSTSLLLPQHQALIDASAIAPDVAAERGYRSITSPAKLRRYGFANYQCRTPGLLVPITDVAGQNGHYQYRPDDPRLNDRGKPIKYETPDGARVVLDVPPRVRPKLGDPTIPLVITEGARKVDSAASHGLCCIGLAGVWGWRGTNAHKGKTALADWEDVALNDRDVVLAFDSDVMTKASVRHAIDRLSAFLRLRGANVRFALLPDGANGEKVGLDDFFAAGNTLDDLMACVIDDLDDAADGVSSYKFVRSYGVAVPNYPVAVWPAPLRAYLEAVAAAVDAPVDMAAVPLLPVLGAVIGNRRSVCVKSGWVERPTIWSSIIADSTTGKSPMLKYALDLVTDLQTDAEQVYRIAMQAYDATRTRNGHEPPDDRPRLEQYWTSNATMEWFGPAARDSAGIAMVRDEQLGWLKDFDVYRSGKGGDRQTWLSLFSGGALKVDRRGAETVYAPHPVVCVTGGIQPDRFPELASDASADGFLARFLLSVPDAWIPGYSDEVLDDEITENARKLVATLRPEQWHEPLPLSESARALFREWHAENADAIANAPPLLRPAFGKFPVYVARIALILHCCDDPAAKQHEIPKARIADALDLIDYHREHAVRAYGLLGIESASGSTGLTRRILDAFERKHATSLNRSQIHSALGGHTKSVDLTAALDALCERGKLSRESISSPGGGRPNDVYSLGPHTNERTNTKKRAYDVELVGERGRL